VRRLHAAGIEVIMDVVYNHTCEGSELGPTLSWRGLDNASYYRLFPGHERHFINDTGCGNTINITHPRVLQMVIDSLRYWATAYRIDGFRFDLGTILGREAEGFDPGSGFFDVLRQDPVLSRLKLISEPWDLGPGGYQLGNHPPGFSEWNGAFRDSVRRFWRGDPGQRAEIAGRLMGSPDLFDHRRRRTTASVNFLTAHDGFTLADLVSYNERHNMQNGEHNQDGHADNISYNWGVEGDTEDKDVLTLRGRVRRAMLATLFVSYGTPMLLAGDEFGQTQHGNNNAYCQDNPLAWLDWRLLEQEQGTALAAFVGRLAVLRRAYASLRSTRFLHGRTEVADGLRDIDWFDETATALTPEAWQDPNARLLAMRRAVREAGGADATLVLFNASHESREFALPQPALDWRIELDSAAPDAAPREVAAQTLTVVSRAVVLLGCRLPEHAPAADSGAHHPRRRRS
jgi:glycogen operon protein